VKKLKHLEQLYLDRTLIADAALDQVGSLTDLAELSLAQTRVSDAGLTHLKTTPPASLAGLDADRHHRCGRRGSQARPAAAGERRAVGKSEGKREEGLLGAFPGLPLFPFFSFSLLILGQTGVDRSRNTPGMIREIGVYPSDSADRRILPRNPSVSSVGIRSCQRRTRRTMARGGDDEEEDEICLEGAGHASRPG